MANYQSLKAAINAVIKANGNKEITGTVLNEVLLAMVNSLGAGYQFAGVATPDTTPGTPDQKVFYIASQAGTYNNFGGAVVSDGIAIFEWNGTWATEMLDLSMAGQVQSDWTETDTTKKSYIKHKPNIPPSANVDPVPTEDSPNAVSSGGTYDMIVSTAATLFGDIQNATDINATLSEDGKIYNDYNAGDIFYIEQDDVRKYRVAYAAGTADAEHPVTINGTLFYFADNASDAIYLSLRIKTVSTEQQSLSSQQKAQARTNIAAVSYDAQSLNAEQQVQAQNNIVGKSYNAAAFSGLGKKVLAKNIQTVSGVQKNVMTQTFFNATNTVYVIQYDYTLGENITIPAGCTLQFDGGSILADGSDKNTLTGNSTQIIADLNKIFSPDIQFAGTWSVEQVYSEWFGSASANNTDNIFIQAASDFANATETKKVVLLIKTYNISSPIVIRNYCQLIGNIDTINREGGTIIHAVNCDAVSLQKNTANEITQISVSNLNIKCDTKQYDGITIAGESDKHIQNIRLQNITVQYARYGLYITNDNFKGVGNFTIDGCAFIRNKIGMFIDGNINATSTAAWFNANKITNCAFLSNSIGGILIKNVRNTLCNTISQCWFEGNGNEYTLADYNTFGCFAIEFKCDDFVSTGTNVIEKCYFEANYPRRTGTVDTGEYTFNNTVMPDAWYNSQIAATIVNKRNRLIIHDCFFSYYYNALLSLDLAGSDISRCDFFADGRFYTGQQIVSDFLLDGITYVGEVSEYDNHFTYETNGIVHSRFNFVNITDATHAQFLSQYTIHSDSIDFTLRRLLRGNYCVNANTVIPALSRLGLTKQVAFDSFAYLYDCINNSSYRVFDDVDVRLFSDIDSGMSANWDFRYNNTYPRIRFFSDENTKPVLSVGFGKGVVILKNDSIFENLTIHIYGDYATGFYSAIAQGKKVIFRNCDFILESDNTYIFNASTADDVMNIQFENCTFTIDSTVGDGKLKFALDDYHKFVYRFADCIVPAASIPVNDIGEPTFYNGTAWVDTVGTQIL